jgi:hypothetical protein
MNKVFSAGDVVEGSGIYLAEHDGGHTEPHEVTLTYGSQFPACRVCGVIRFRPVRLAHSVGFYTFLSTKDHRN